MKISRIFWITCSCLYTALLVYVSIRPADMSHTPSTAKQMAHNFFHVPAYALLAYCLVQSFGRFDSKAKLSVFLIAFTVGAFNEFFQSLIPSRMFSFSDMALNAVGIILLLMFIEKGVLKIL